MKPLNHTVSNPINHDDIVSWFTSLRDQICASFEAIEATCQNPLISNPQGTFVRTKWDRPGGGGGEISLMRGRIFEKVGVNISIVHGAFAPEFRNKIPHTGPEGEFWASGVSVVAHMHSPYMPAMHFNTRCIQTTKHWFGGGMDVTPTFPVTEDTQDYHQKLKAMCDPFDATYYPRFKKWCDEYFYLKHRQESRGVGGIFFDDLDTSNWLQDWAFVKAVGTFFKDYSAHLYQKHYSKPWTAEEREALLLKRGRYVEFNLLYDRGTKFGLETNGNMDAIFMSMPPEVKWG